VASLAEFCANRIKLRMAGPVADDPVAEQTVIVGFDEVTRRTLQYVAMTTQTVRISRGAAGAEGDTYGCHESPLKHVNLDG
jgi:hypothetical protein